MTTHFLRLALIAAGMGLVAVLVLFAEWRSWWEALIVGTVGLAVAVAVTIEERPSPVAKVERSERPGRQEFEDVDTGERTRPRTPRSGMDTGCGRER